MRRGRVHVPLVHRDVQALGDSRVLSATNPLATEDQRDLEALALRILAAPEMEKAKDNAAARVKILAGRDGRQSSEGVFKKKT